LNPIEPDFQSLLRNIQIRFTHFFARVLEGKKTTLPQYNVLVTLVSEGPLPMNHVAKKLRITKPAITHLVDRLEKEKLIRRDSHPHDRRIFLLRPTDKGKNLVQSVQKSFLEFVTEPLSKISEKDREIIKRFYGILIKELDRVLSDE